jgi:heterotetrameric sarcosine oxidase gamma subunit
MIQKMNGSVVDHHEKTHMNDEQTMPRVESALKQAGLTTTEFNNRTIELRELTGLAIARLSSLDSAPGLCSQTGQCTGTDPVVLCLRPEEWLLISASMQPDQLLSHAGPMLNPEVSAISDHSHGMAVFRLQGEGAPWLLSKLSGLDYLSSQSAKAHCAQTLMGHIGVLVAYHQVDEGPFVFDLVFDRSFARYFWELLVESSAHADELAKSYGDAA